MRPCRGLADHFVAETILIVTDGSRTTRWAEQLELERTRAELDIPTAHVVVSSDSKARDARRSVAVQIRGLLLTIGPRGHCRSERGEHELADPEH